MKSPRCGAAAASFARNCSRRSPRPTPQRRSRPTCSSPRRSPRRSPRSSRPGAGWYPPRCSSASPCRCSPPRWPTTTACAASACRPPSSRASATSSGRTPTAALTPRARSTPSGARTSPRSRQSTPTDPPRSDATAGAFQIRWEAPAVRVSAPLLPREFSALGVQLMPQPVAFVTGASTGIGFETAKKLASAGFTVYAGARRVELMEPLKASGVKVMALDVTDEASMSAAVGEVLAAHGRIDVLVNNAGYGSYGSLEEVELAEGRRQFEVNLFGLARMTQLVLPAMRAAGRGRIINISSIGGKMYEPLGAWYHATKFAVEGLSDSLRVELKPHGIDVAIIEPGGTQSEWGTISAEGLLANSGSGPYAAQAKVVAAALASTDGSAMSSHPEVIAEAIVHAATSPRPRTRYPVGKGARAILLLRRLLPDRAFDTVLWAIYKRFPGQG